jgi:septal ring factor EnvC (AmiA/AmiB activator)
MLESRMTPDTPESRLAALAQRVNDFIETTLERFRTSDAQIERRFRELDEDIRVFAPIVREVDKLRDGQQRNNERLAEMSTKIDAIHKRLDVREESEAAERKDRDREKRASARQLWVILITVLATSGAGLLIQVLHVGAH